MASPKAETPPYHYDPLPPDPQHHQPPQYYVVLPLYVPEARRRRWRRRLACAATIALLAVAVYVLWPSDPYLKVERLRLDRLHFRVKSNVDVDITLGVTVKVRNPDVYSMTYQSLNVSIGYRGEQLGFVTSDHGHVRATGSSYVDATLDLDGVEVLSNAIFFIEDLVRGTVPFDKVTEIRGKLGFFFFELPMKAKLSCQIYVNVSNQTIVRQSCYPG